MESNYYFVVIDGPLLGAVVAVDTAGGFRIGRACNSHFVVPHAAISRKHVRVFLRAGRPWIEDLSSKNGTVLEGIELRASAPLSPGDCVVLGNTLTLLFVAEERDGHLAKLCGRKKALLIKDRVHDSRPTREIVRQ